MKKLKSAQEIQDEIFKKMSPEKRLQIAGELFEFAQKMLISQRTTIYDRIRKSSSKNNICSFDKERLKRARIKK